jgi:hypothetical protein
MAEIAWQLLQPVDIGAQVQQGFATGAALVKHGQTQHALKAYLANPDDPKAFSALAYYDPATAHDMQTTRILQQKMQRETDDRGRAVALGQLATKDLAGARQEALAAGDFDLAKTFGELDDESRKRAAAFWTDAAPLAFTLRHEPDPEKRKALFAQARPILQAHGADPAQLDSFDPTNDTALDAVIATGQKVSELIEQSRAHYVQQGELPSIAVDYWGKPISGAAPAPSGAPATAPAAAGDVGNVLSQAGMPAPVVAGFLGNFHVEGGYGGAKGDGGASTGIAQWNGERATNFQRVIGKPVAQATPVEQARFVAWEMQNPVAAGMTVAQRDQILAARTPEEAAALIDQFYERSSGEHRQHRVAAASYYGAERPTSKAEYDALPKGASYVAPDGSHRVKS